jgi:hypothetical protein
MSEKRLAQVIRTECFIRYPSSYLRTLQCCMNSFTIDRINQVGGIPNKEYPLPMPSARGRVGVGK